MTRLGTIITASAWIAIAALLGAFFHSMHKREMEERRLREAVANLMDEDQYAQFIVDKIERDAATGAIVTHLRWSEVNSKGQKIGESGERAIQVLGDDVYVDSWQILFDPDSVKEGDPLRGKSLTLFSRIYGANQRPSDGTPLNVPEKAPSEDEADQHIPGHFRPTKASPSEFERDLWADFFHLCTDAEYAQERKVRTVQGTAVHKPVVEGKLYRVAINRMGQITIGNPEDPPPFTGH